jgi:pimeloyl-ACP methyl ester carboxylesterase
MATVEISGGRRVNYDLSGDGPDLLLINGRGGQRASWNPVVGMLSPWFRVITFDNRDAGENEPETNPYSIADLASDAADLLDALDIERAHTLGHSMGGFIALHLVLNRPRLVDRLMLVSTSPVVGSAIGRPLTLLSAGEWDSDPVARARASAPASHAPGYLDAHPDALQEIGELARGNRITLDGYNRQQAAISETHDVRERLSEIDAPTLVVHGDVDALIPLRGGEMLATGIPNARLVVYPGVGHVPHREAAEQFRRDVLDFLSVQL